MPEAAEQLNPQNPGGKKRKSTLKPFHREGTCDFHHGALSALRYIHQKLSKKQNLMTKQQHLNHSPQKQEFKAINTARQLNNATGGCRHCRGCKTQHRGSLGVITCHLLSTTSPCAQRQWEGKFVPAAGACFPSLAAPFPPQHMLAPSPTQEFLGLSLQVPDKISHSGAKQRPRNLSQSRFSTACEVPLIQGFY